MSGRVTIDGAASSYEAASRRYMEYRANKLARNFAGATETAGLGNEFSTASGSSGVQTPRVVHIDLGESPYLMVQLPAGLLPADFDEVHDRLASGLGCERLSFVRRGQRFMKVYLDPVDPLDSSAGSPEQVSSGVLPVTFGQLESGRMLQESLAECGHIAAQGQTRSGKTRWTYGVLAQLAGAEHVEIAGLDPTGKTLGPWQGHPQGCDRIAATGHADELERVSAGLVADMETRIQAIPRDRDTLPLGDGGWPVRVVVLEEWAGCLTVVSTARGKGVQSVQVYKDIQRLLAEGHKAGYRVIMLSQRFDGQLIGGFNRDNLSHRFSFRTASQTGLEMLHEGIGKTQAVRHGFARPGIALADTPATGLQRLRALDVTSYTDYLSRIDATRTTAREVLSAAA